MNQSSLKCVPNGLIENIRALASKGVASKSKHVKSELIVIHLLVAYKH